jgi:hypothetical protein
LQRTAPLERNIVFAYRQFRECSAWKRQICNDVQVQDVVSIHEKDLTSFRCIEFVAEPISSRLVISPPATMKA